MVAHSTILITGGAGFVGSSLAVGFRRERAAPKVISFDNLRRRGSELTLARLREAGVTFVHGDVRNPSDLAAVGDFDLLVDCAAEPSVQAGQNGSPAYVIDTNLIGTVNCLEAVRLRRADMVYLSTSRVYPIPTLRALPLERAGGRFVVTPGCDGPGWSAAGISASFPLAGWRSIYGATKLASELLAAEYAQSYGLQIIVNRCGVLAGPWQMGKVDQGFVTLWAARHLYGGQLSYTGYGGEGLQVRDILHVADLYDLISRQLAEIKRHSGATYNVGGGPKTSVSLAELTALCRERAGHTLAIAKQAETHAADIPYYVSDNTAIAQATGWAPRFDVHHILDDIFAWLETNTSSLRPILS